MIFFPLFLFQSPQFRKNNWDNRETRSYVHLYLQLCTRICVRSLSFMCPPIRGNPCTFSRSSRDILASEKSPPPLWTTEESWFTKRARQNISRIVHVRTINHPRDGSGAGMGESRAFVTKCASLAIYALFRSIRRCQEQWRNYRSFREDSSTISFPCSN